VPAEEKSGAGTRHVSLVKVAYPAQKTGTYRIYVQPPNASPTVVSNDFNLLQSGTPQAYPSFTQTFSSNTPMDVWGGSGYFFYIPKGVQQLDFEIPSYAGLTYVFSFFTGLPTAGMTATRTVNVTPGSNGWKYGYNSIPLNLTANETGTIAWVNPTGGPSGYKKMPYLDSVPMRFAFNTAQLAIPRAVVTADGLTPR
jgi:hypothetical protein